MHRYNRPNKHCPDLNRSNRGNYRGKGNTITVAVVTITIIEDEANIEETKEEVIEEITTKIEVTVAQNASLKYTSKINIQSIYRK